MSQLTASQMTELVQRMVRVCLVEDVKKNLDRINESIYAQELKLANQRGYEEGIKSAGKDDDFYGGWGVTKPSEETTANLERLHAERRDWEIRLSNGEQIVEFVNERFATQEAKCA